MFETFPQPDLTPEVASVGKALDEHRRALMRDRWEGLTATYNRVHNPDERAADIAALRDLHVALDHAVAGAYGWSDVDLGHGFHDTRHTTELRTGLHSKKRKSKYRPSSGDQDRLLHVDPPMDR